MLQQIRDFDAEAGIAAIMLGDLLAIKVNGRARIDAGEIQIKVFPFFLLEIA